MLETRELLVSGKLTCWHYRCGKQTPLLGVAGWQALMRHTRLDGGWRQQNDMDGKSPQATNSSSPSLGEKGWVAFVRCPGTHARPAGCTALYSAMAVGPPMPTCTQAGKGTAPYGEAHGIAGSHAPNTHHFNLRPWQVGCFKLGWDGCNFNPSCRTKGGLYPLFYSISSCPTPAPKRLLLPAPILALP